MRMTRFSFRPYLDMLMSGFSQPIRRPSFPHVTMKARLGAGSGAELRLKAVDRTQRTQCRQKQGLSVRGTL